MNLSSMLARVHDQSYWSSKPVICFYGKEYPYYFLQKLFMYLEQKQIFTQVRTKHALALQQPFDVKAAINLLQQTMLGQSYVYWLGDINLLCAGKQKDQLLTFLTSYKGPNQLFFFSDVEPKLLQDAVIEIPPVIKEAELQLLYAWYQAAEQSDGLNHPKKREFLTSLFVRHQVIALDAVSMLMEYIATMSVRNLDELAVYLEKTIASPQSLTVLVDAFFSRNAKKFFELWKAVQDEYPPVFWLVYWSDYVWRAYCVVHFLQSNQLLEAKKAGYKMPYFFMTNGWRKYSLEYLAKCYQELYTIDFTIKQGALSTRFELFFLTHFLDTK